MEETVSMKIAIINTNDESGGAARAASRLHKALLSAGNNARYLVRSKTTSDTNTILISESIESRKRNKYANQFYKEHVQVELINQDRSSLTDTMFSFGYPGLLIEHIPEILDADIINIHWVNGLLSPHSVDRILASGKPVIWTLHDMWPFTGGCHYTAGCIGFKTDCGNCPQLANDKYDLPSGLLKDKVDFFNKDNLTIVTPSNWLRREAEMSAVFGQREILTIPNAVNHELYTDTDRQEVRRLHKVADDEVLLLFGAVNGKSKRKGFDLLSQAISYLVETNRAGNLKILCLGHPSTTLESLGLPVINAGYTEDEKIIAGYYAAADIFVLPSREDNLPNTILEAFSCNTPVVAFSVGGIEDLIEDGYNGYKVPAFDCNLLAERIYYLAADSVLRQTLADNARATIERAYTLKHQAKSYAELFARLHDTKAIKTSIPNSSFVQEGVKAARIVRGSAQSGNGLNDRTNNFFRRVLFDYYHQQAQGVLEPKFSTLVYFFLKKIYRRLKKIPFLNSILLKLAPKIVNGLSKNRVA
jgi:glycosyltransferase involved in cell wall biosynthesis